MSDDLGLQRAIWNSIQSASRPTVTRSSYAPAPRLQPTVPFNRSAYSAAQDRPAPVPRPVHRVSSEPSVGRRNTLAREGITHTNNGREMRSPTKMGGRIPQPRSSRDDDSLPTSYSHLRNLPGTSRPSNGSDDSALHGNPPVSRRGNAVHGWTDILRGGKLQRQNPSGSHLQVVCEDGWNRDTKRLHERYCLLSVTDLPSELSGKKVTISMNAKLSCHASTALLFGVVINFTTDETNNSQFLLAAITQSQSSRTQVTAQILRCSLRERSNVVEVIEEVTHASNITVKMSQNLQLSIYRAADRLEFFVNGTKVFKNVAVDLPTSLTFGLCSCGTKAQVRDIQCSEGPPDANGDGEGGKRIDKNFAAIIEQDILDTSPSVQWEDIAALDEAKRLLNEAVVLPLIIPEMFTGIRKPWQGVLLFGPPGTGKTLLAKAVATCANTTFFNMTASSLLSKWHGESEKMVATLFQLARKHAPSTIFFDEIDSLMMKRGDHHEHESSRRLKSELLSQMDGINSDAEKRVMVLATSNKPWDLDEAFRRRLEKRIYIPLPEEAARKELFVINMKSMEVDSSVSFDELSRMTQGYSGADITHVCRDASMGPMRRLIANKSPAEIARMKAEGQLDTATVLSKADFVEAIQKIQPSVAPSEISRYLAWEKEFAST